MSCYLFLFFSLQVQQNFNQLVIQLKSFILNLLLLFFGAFQVILNIMLQKAHILLNLL